MADRVNGRCSRQQSARPLVDVGKGQGRGELADPGVNGVAHVRVKSLHAQITEVIVSIVVLSNHTEKPPLLIQQRGWRSDDRTREEHRIGDNGLSGLRADIVRYGKVIPRERGM